MSICDNSITFYRFDGECFTLVRGWTNTTTFEMIYNDDSPVEMCKDFIMFYKFDGENHELETRNCVTIASKEYALMAAHCLPENIEKDSEFDVRMYVYTFIQFLIYSVISDT